MRSLGPLEPLKERSWKAMLDDYAGAALEFKHSLQVVNCAGVLRQSVLTHVSCCVTAWVVIRMTVPSESSTRR